MRERKPTQRQLAASRKAVTGIVVSTAEEIFGPGLLPVEVQVTAGAYADCYELNGAMPSKSVVKERVFGILKPYAMAYARALMAKPARRGGKKRND